MFGNGGIDPTNMTELERSEFAYGKILDGYLHSVDSWAKLSLDYRDGKVAATDVINAFDVHMAKQGFILMLLDNIRKAKQTSNIDSEVEKFKQQLNDMPTTDEPSNDL